MEVTDKDILISQVQNSFGEDCTKGTIDAREVTIQDEGNASYVLISNNNLSKECNIISIALSGDQTKRELSEEIPIEQTSDFSKLATMGINLERIDAQLDPQITVCGVEQEKFDLYKNRTLGRTR